MAERRATNASVGVARVMTITVMEALWFGGKKREKRRGTILSVRGDSWVWGGWGLSLPLKVFQDKKTRSVWTWGTADWSGSMI